MAIGSDGSHVAPAAARAVDAVKIYGVGDAEVRALDGIPSAGWARRKSDEQARPRAGVR